METIRIYNVAISAFLLKLMNQARSMKWASEQLIKK